MEAFYHLGKYLDSLDKERILLFIDELPWMDTKRSNFLDAFIYFWNSYCSFHKNIMLIICGSASSWILDNVIHDVGGLYDRVTYKMKLSPFNLKEVEELLHYQGINFSRYETTEAYMAFGGIPYYYGYFNPALSLSQNIDRILFNKNALLKKEFNELFSSQFTKYQDYIKIVECLSKRGIGYTPKEIAKECHLIDNGEFYRMLDALEESDFIMRYTPFGESRKIINYKLIDPYCYFYLNVVKDNENKDGYYSSLYLSPYLNTMRGLFFELICYHHLRQIVQKLSISGLIDVEATYYFKKGNDNQRGTQVDLILNRSDRVINVCEMKFYQDDFQNNDTVHMNIVRRNEILNNLISRRAHLVNVLITTYGLKEGKYSSDFGYVITLEDLFK